MWLGYSKQRGELRLQMEAGAKLFGNIEAHVKDLIFYSKFDVP